MGVQIPRILVDQKPYMHGKARMAGRSKQGTPDMDMRHDLSAVKQQARLRVCEQPALRLCVWGNDQHERSTLSDWRSGRSESAKCRLSCVMCN